jgi:hypothetical protein
MLGGKTVAYWKRRLNIRKTRNTKKSELVKALEGIGWAVDKEGRFSSSFSPSDLDSDALLKGYLEIDGRNEGHWAVWDHKQQVVRDPYGYRAPFRLTSYTTIK